MNHTPLLAAVLAVTIWLGVACQSKPPPPPPKPKVELGQGRYAVQSARYQDASATYQILLLDTPPGAAPMFETAQLRLAQTSTLSSAFGGKKTYLEIAGNVPTLYLSPGFEIQFTHAVTEERVGSSGQREVVVIREESSSWSPFVAGMAGAAIGNALTTPTYVPQYYVPPPYTSGGRMTGYGSSGRIYQEASTRHVERYGVPPPKPVTTIRSTSVPTGKSGSTLRATGQGASGSRFKPSTAPSAAPKSNSSFGRSSSPSRSPGSVGSFGRKR
jgi:hypothetical protein